MTVRAVVRLGMPVLRGFLCASVLSCGAVDAAPAREARVAPHDASSGHAAAKPPADELGAQVRYVVQLGEMRSGSGVGGDGIPRVLRDCARAHANALQGASVIDAGGPLAQEAAERHLPVITLNGVVTLGELPVSAGLEVRANVEFAVRRDQVLKVLLTGAATARGSSPTISDRGRRVLEEGAIDGAVQVALGGADQGLMVAAR
jgi:hypothetical protein